MHEQDSSTRTAQSDSLRLIERAWIWRRDDGAWGVRLSEPTEALLAAPFLRWEEVVPAAATRGAVDLLRDLLDAYDDTGWRSRHAEAAREFLIHHEGQS